MSIPPPPPINALATFFELKKDRLFKKGLPKEILKIWGKGQKYDHFQIALLLWQLEKVTLFITIQIKYTQNTKKMLWPTFVAKLACCNPCFTSPCFTSRCFTNPCFTTPCFTTPCFTCPCFANPCFLETFGLNQHVACPTHTSGHTLDLIISRSINDVIITELESTLALSDHSFIECNLNMPKPNFVVKELRFRQLKRIDIPMFKNDISGSDLCVNSFSDIEEFSRCYDTTLLNLLDKHAPIKTKKMVMRPVVPWFTDELKKLKAERRRCERKMLLSGCSHDKELYYKTRDKYSALLRKTKTSYYSDLIDKCSGNSKKLFRVINSLSKQKSSESLPPYEDQLILANEFGTFFGRKIELINDEINKISVNPITTEHRVPDKLLKSFSPVSQDDIRGVILKASNASCQLDPIPTYLLKDCCDVLCPIITKMINMSLEKGIVPENWKLALVNPLLKKLGMDLVFENFRPVNNLHFLTKVAEKVVTSQLVNHCNENAPLPVNQSAYRQLHSTETALLKVQNDILINMDNEEVTLLVMLDMSAAFDTIDHNILIDILKNDFGVVDSALQWFISYLANRKQQNVIDRCKSSEFMVAAGVPQGSCLGPVLFLLYVSGLSGIISKHLPCHHAFADDTQLYLSFKPQNSLHQESAVKAMEDCIDELRNWMTAHRLFIQSSKTEFIIIGSRQQLSKVSIDKLRVGEVLISPCSKRCS